MEHLAVSVNPYYHFTRIVHIRGYHHMAGFGYRHGVGVQGVEFDELVVVANHSVAGQQSVDIACQLEISCGCRNAAYCGQCRRYRFIHNGRILVKLQKNNCLAIIYMRAE
jgi:hypothetical protein